MPDGNRGDQVIRVHVTTTRTILGAGIPTRLCYDVATPCVLRWRHGRSLCCQDSRWLWPSETRGLQTTDDGRIDGLLRGQTMAMAIGTMRSCRQMTAAPLAADT